MRNERIRRPLAALFFLASGMAGAPAAAQEVAGLTFDVAITTGDSSTGTTQTGKGWIWEKRTRIDLHGAANAANAIPGLAGENISMMVHDSGETPVVTLLDHDTRQVMYPAKMMEQLGELLEVLPEQPRMTLSVTNVAVDSLGAGVTTSGFATKRFRLTADIAMTVDMMGESVIQSMHIESEGDYAEELSDFNDPLRGSRAFQAFTSGIPWMDSSATAEMNKVARVTPRGLPLRQVDRVTGVTEGGDAPQTTVTVLSNVKRARFSPAVFAVPEGYTELEMPQMPPMN